MSPMSPMSPLSPLSSFSSPSWSRLALLAGAAVLAWHPVLWLVITWTDPSYASDGALAALGVAALGLWSLSSPRTAQRQPRPMVILSLAIMALVRFAAEALGVNVLGALTLAVDVGALAAWAGLAQRRRAVSPLWLGVVFLFALPVERVLQRTMGYGLQSLSAEGACGLLALADPSVSCAGIRILMNGREALVDLPCSGARSLIVLLALFSVCAALARPRPLRAWVGLGITVAAALGANVVRIAMLAVGIAYPDAVGVDVMAAPWHEGIGLLALAAGAAPILVWFRAVPARARIQVGPCRIRPPRAASPSIPLAGAALFLACALLIIAVPARPVDVAQENPPLELPARLGTHPARFEPLTAQETAYFTQYGGSAARAAYGGNTLTMVRTSAPLRHLHAPDECLRGLGHTVRHMGTR
ncbi:MAG: exosortase T, partial [Microvirga sp.]